MVGIYIKLSINRESENERYLGVDGCVGICMRIASILSMRIHGRIFFRVPLSTASWGQIHHTHEKKQKKIRTDRDEKFQLYNRRHLYHSSSVVVVFLLLLLLFCFLLLLILFSHLVLCV